MTRQRNVVVAGVGEPVGDLASAIHPRRTRRTADAQMHRTPGDVQVFGNLATRLATADDQNGAVWHGLRIAVVRRMQLQHVGGQTFGGARNHRGGVDAVGDHHLPGQPVAGAGVHGKLAVGRLAHRQHFDAFAQRRVEAGAIGVEVFDDLVLGHEAVGVGAAVGAVVGEARQAALPVGRDQAERIPARVAPLAEAALALEHHVLDTGLLQMPAHRQAGLAAADDHHVNAARADEAGVGRIQGRCVPVSRHGSSPRSARR